MSLIGVTNAHDHLLKPSEGRSPTYNISTLAVCNHARLKPTLDKKLSVDGWTKCRRRDEQQDWIISQTNFGFFHECSQSKHYNFSYGVVLLSISFFFKKNGPTPASFCLFLFFSNTIFTEKTADISGIGTRIVRVEGEHADHLTTTMALPISSY